MKIHEFIKQRRISLNLTILDIAEYVGVSEATVSRWESGHISNMKRSRIAKLAEILKVSPSCLCSEDIGEEVTVPVKKTKKEEFLQWIRTEATMEDLAEIFQVISNRFSAK